LQVELMQVVFAALEHAFSAHVMHA